MYSYSMCFSNTLNVFVKFTHIGMLVVVFHFHCISLYEHAIYPFDC